LFVEQSLSKKAASSGQGLPAREAGGPADIPERIRGGKSPGDVRSAAAPRRASLFLYVACGFVFGGEFGCRGLWQAALQPLF